MPNNVVQVSTFLSLPRLHFLLSRRFAPSVYVVFVCSSPPTNASLWVQYPAPFLSVNCLIFHDVAVVPLHGPHNPHYLNVLCLDLAYYGVKGHLALSLFFLVNIVNPLKQPKLILKQQFPQVISCVK